MSASWAATRSHAIPAVGLLTKHASISPAMAAATSRTRAGRDRLRRQQLVKQGLAAGRALGL